jgi:hypothetical protein
MVLVVGYLLLLLLLFSCSFVAALTIFHQVVDFTKTIHRASSTLKPRFFTKAWFIFCRYL